MGMTSSAASRLRTVTLLTVAVVMVSLLFSTAARADVGLSLRANLWETVPKDDPVYEDLSKLADLGVIRIPDRVRSGALTRYDIADLIYRASRELEARHGTELSLNGTDGQAIVAGLKEKYSDEIQWVRWSYSRVPLFDSGEPMVGSVSGISQRDGVSAVLDVSRERLTASLPSLPPASRIAADSELTYSTEPLVVRIPGSSGMTLNVAGTLAPLVDRDLRVGEISPYSIYPESVRGLKYRIDAEARSPGFEFHLSHEGTSLMPRHSISADSSQSEASAIYKINSGISLAAGMVVKSGSEGVKSASGIDLTFQVVPRYLSAILGLNVGDPESDEFGADDWRRLSTEIGLSGQYPISSAAMLRGAYSYQMYASRADRPQTTLSTGVDYTPAPGTTVTAELEVVDDPEKGVSSEKGVGLAFQVDPNSTVQLNLFHSDGGGSSSGSGAKWGAEFQWKFKF